jgi:phosphatidylglycerophosphate synthase
MTDPHSRALVVELRGVAIDPAAGPLAIVCGLPLLVRNLLVLQRAGYRLAALVLDPGLRAAIEGGIAPHRQRLQLELRFLESAAPLLEAIAPLLEEDGPSAILIWPGALSFGRFAPELASAVVDPGEAVLAPAGEVLQGLALVGREAAREGLERGERLEGMLERMTREGSAKAGGIEAREAFRVCDRAARDQAERALLVSLRKPVDGAVAKFDRYVSLFISRRLMHLPITPNQVTVVAGLIGVACGVIASRGGYWAMLIGALGFQLNSILDGIDGEIARAKLHESRIGQWLDTWADDSSNLAFMVGACIGCYRTWGSELYLVLAAVTGGGLLITAALMYHYVITVAHSGDLNDFKMPWEERAAGAAEEREAKKGGFSRVLASLKFVVRRDTFVFLTTLFALAGQLRVMTWFYAAGASSVWLAILVYRVLLPAFRRRPA